MTKMINLAGYTLTTGKKSLDMGEIKILTGGRGKKQD